MGIRKPGQELCYNNWGSIWGQGEHMGDPIALLRGLLTIKIVSRFFSFSWHNGPAVDLPGCWAGLTVWLGITLTLFEMLIKFI